MEFEELIRETYSDRDRESKKYDQGLVLTVGGSKIYSGSPALSSLAAIKTGADLSQVAAPYRAANIVANQSPDLVTFPFEGEKFEFRHLNELLSITRSAKEVSRGNIAVVIGGGMGRDEDTKKLIREYLKALEVPAVVDADGIYSFEKEGEEIITDDMIFTPHLYEFYVLTDKRVGDMPHEEKVDVVRRKAAELSTIITLKGATDIISDGSEVIENDYGVPELAAGGCGDVLAGVIGSLLARGLEPKWAAALATYINARAGELTVAEKGEGLTAEDVLNNLPKVINN